MSEGIGRITIGLVKRCAVAVGQRFHRHFLSRLFTTSAFLLQGRKADTARDRGLSALPSSAPSGVDRPLPFSPLFSFIPRFCLDFIAPDFRSGTLSTRRWFADGRMRANAKRRYYTKRRGNLPCRLRLKRLLGKWRRKGDIVNYALAFPWSASTGCSATRFRGRPRGRRLDSSPNRRAASSLQNSPPNGRPRATLTRNASTSAAVCG
jgi:hypothetical protein